MARLVPPAGDGWSGLVDAGRVRPPRGRILDAVPGSAAADAIAALEEAR